LEEELKKLKDRHLPKIFKNALKAWWAKDPFKESAVIAYYAIFSLPGLFVVIVTLAGLFFGRQVVDEHLVRQISATLGESTANQIQNIINAQVKEISNSVPGAVVGVVVLLVGATGVFAQFQKSLNYIWDVKADVKKSGIWSLLKVRLFSFGLIVSIAFLLIVSLLVSTLLTAFGNWLTNQFSESLLIILRVLNFVISLSILTVLFALMLRVFPDARIKWKDVWIGSVVTAVLFDIGKFGLSLYFGKANPATAYGVAGSIILILLWVSYSSMIVFYGAEFTREYANLNSGKVAPNEIARPNEKK
jgi:membrane protein